MGWGHPALGLHRQALRPFLRCHAHPLMNACAPLRWLYPQVTVYGDPSFTFPYVPSHLHHMVRSQTSQAGGGRVPGQWRAVGERGRVLGQWRAVGEGEGSACAVRAVDVTPPGTFQIPAALPFQGATEL